MLDGSIGPTNLSAFFLHRASSSCVYFPREIAPLVLSFSFEATLVDSAEGEDVGNDGPTSGPIAGPTTHLGIGQQGGPMAFLFLSLLHPVANQALFLTTCFILFHRHQKRRNGIHTTLLLLHKLIADSNPTPC